MKDFGKWTGKDRERAQRLTSKAVKLGLLKRPTKCAWCGQEQGIIHAHDTDYDVVLNLMPKLIDGTATEEEKAQINAERIPLCWRCHMMLHKGDKHPKSLAAYKDRIKSGEKFAPVYRGNDWEKLNDLIID